MSETINASTLKKWLQDKQEIALFDIREAGQFGEGHLFFAVPLPYSRLEVDVLRLAPRKSVRIVLVDDGDALAVVAARRLTALGYRQVFVLEEGVHGWSKAGYTLFKGVNVPSKTFGELVEHAYQTPHISAPELAAWRAQGKQFALLDGRTVEEHHKMTIPGSVSVPNGELAYRLRALVPDEQMPIVINCAGRTRSILGAQTLRNLALPNPVWALENGTQGWYLAGLELEHGSQTRYADTAPADLSAERQAAEQLRRRFEIPVLGSQEAQAWVDDASRTTFVFDIRTAQEFAEHTLAGAQHAAGGQLIQATDQYLGVRNSRLILLDHESVRASVVASWLYQLGYEVAVLKQGIATPLRLPSLAPERSWPAADHLRLKALLGRHDVSLIDIRASAAYRKEHVVSSRWSIRPRLLKTLLSGGDSGLPAVLVLIAGDGQIAALAAAELREAGVAEVLWSEGLGDLAAAGYALQQGAVIPEDAERIDYLFFVHDRHEGNRAAAEQYLSWETGLIAQCTQDELGVFRLPR